MTESTGGKGSPGAEKGTEVDGPKKTIREWGKALWPYGVGFFAVLTPIVLISTCQLQRLDALREDVNRETTEIHKEIKTVSKEVHSNAKDIAVLQNQVETVGKSVEKIDQKLDRILELPAKRVQRRAPVIAPTIKVKAANPPSVKRKE